MLVNRYGLHARPAMQFVDLAGRYGAAVSVGTDERRVDGKSIIGILTLGAAKGVELIIAASGEDAEEAVAALAELVARGFADLD